jgi:hypothetical protein
MEFNGIDSGNGAKNAMTVPHKTNIKTREISTFSRKTETMTNERRHGLRERVKWS